jgi:capsular exopolysaccharide synthesis family protein
MSRIFDALSKAENERKERTDPSSAAATAWREWAGAVAGSAGRLDELPVLRCTGDGNPRPTPRLDDGEETFRLLRHRLELIRRRRPLGKLLVTSAIPKEGKTTVATHLAAALARGSGPVLLVDADLRHPGVDRALGLASRNGLGDWLEQRAELDAALRRVDPHGFVYLPAGETRENPAEVLRRAPLAEFLAASAASFDWIVIDSPPLVPFVDAHYLATLADGVLLVLRENVTPRPAIEQAFASLERAFIAGAVLNGVHDANHGYYEYYGEERAARRSRPSAALEPAAASKAAE